ncbi:hypothetical protein PAMP_020104 [Pampus punctatissimus]
MDEGGETIEENSNWRRRENNDNNNNNNNHQQGLKRGDLWALLDPAGPCCCCCCCVGASSCEMEKRKGTHVMDITEERADRQSPTDRPSSSFLLPPSCPPPLPHPKKGGQSICIVGNLLHLHLRVTGVSPLSL